MTIRLPGGRHHALHEGGAAVVGWYVGRVTRCLRSESVRLILPRCQLRPPALRLLLPPLRDRRSAVVLLDLSGNALGLSGAQLLRSVIRRTRTLCTLVLEDCGLAEATPSRQGQNAVTALSDALRANATVRTLSLARNGLLAVDHEAPLRRLLRWSLRLRRVDLRGNPGLLDGDAANRWVPLMRENTIARALVQGVEDHEHDGTLAMARMASKAAAGSRKRHVKPAAGAGAAGTTADQEQKAEEEAEEEESAQEDSDSQLSAESEVHDSDDAPIGQPPPPGGAGGSNRKAARALSAHEQARALAAHNREEAHAVAA